MSSFDEKIESLKESFQEKCPEYANGFHDFVFVRFLRGEKGVVESALGKLIKTAHWRLETKADTLTFDQCSGYCSRRVTFIDGTDKIGRTVVNIMAGRHDRDDRDIEEIKIFIIVTLDTAVKLAKDSNEQVTVIADLSAFTMKCMDFESVRIFLVYLQGYYPETLGQALIIDAPFIFRACWAIIRPWLDPVTALKFQFINSSQLYDFIDPFQVSSDIRRSLKLTVPEDKFDNKTGNSIKTAETIGFGSDDSSKSNVEEIEAVETR